MLVPVLILYTSLLGIVAALTLPGLSDLMLLSVPCAIAGLFLLLRALVRRRRSTATHGFDKATPNWIVVDGSNVMHWKDNTPRIESLREVVDHLAARGYTPGVVFDANAGYKITGKYLHDGALGRMLGLPEDQIMVVPKGTPADPTVLAAARDLGARIVTNDRYRDWADAHPEVRDKDTLIRGGFQSGTLWLDLEGSGITRTH